MKFPLIENLADSRILIVGDVMLDRYWWGTVRRISPEAPVPVLNLLNATHALGGAANVAANVAGLGGKPCLIGVCGKDEAGEILQKELAQKNIDAGLILPHDERRTTVKTRIVAHNQHIVRIDEEKTDQISRAVESEILKKIDAVIEQCQVIIISDYGKGVITKKIIKRLITTRNNENKIVLVDPKGESFSKYQGATLLTPNLSEFQKAANNRRINPDQIAEAGERLRRILKLDALLITRGEDGMLLIEENKKPRQISTETRQVYDVTGAGDTVIAALAVGLAAKINLPEAVKFANYCAGLVVEQVGTTVITRQMLED